jgi:hypothetical protein
VPRAELACGRVGDDVDGMAVQPDRPALRLLSGPAACMTTSWCICMARGIGPPRVSVVVLAPQARAACHGPRSSRSWGELVRGIDFSCEAGTSRARWGLVVRDRDLSCEAETCRARRRLVGGIPLVGNWSEMLPTSRNRDVLPVWVLTGVFSLPHLESWP